MDVTSTWRYIAGKRYLEPLLPRQLRRQETRIPRFAWDEDPAGDWHADVRQIAIYVNESGAWREIDTDHGLNFLTVLAEATHAARRYTALWIPPDSSARTFLFRVRTATGVQLCSQPFTVAGIRAEAPVPPVPPSTYPAGGPFDPPNGGHSR
jgi:hypothetical protein